jgi:hypothetical protein
MCRKAQQFVKQSPSRKSTFLELAKLLDQFVILRVTKVQVTRFLEDELESFRALLEMLPVLLLAMEAEVEKNKREKKKGYKKANKKWNKFIKLGRTAKTIVWLAVLTDFDTLAVQFSKKCQDNTIVASDLEEMINDFYRRVRDMQTTPLKAGQMERLLHDKTFLEKKTKTYQNTEGIAMAKTVIWPGAKNTPKARRQYMNEFCNVVCKKFLGIQVKAGQCCDEM